MSWRPVVTDPVERARILAVIREIADAVAAYSIDDGDLDARVDRAVLRRYLALDGTVPDPDDAAGNDLAEAIEILGGGGYGAALYGGATRVGWGVAHLAEGEEADHACRALDATLARLMAPAAWEGDYDLILGLIGIGVYGLERTDDPSGRAVVARVLDHLEHLACERGGGTAWFTRPELLPPSHRKLAPRGFYNLGLAHGTPGVIAWLVRCVMHDVHAERARALIAGAVVFIVGAASTDSDVRYPRWHVDGGTSEPASSRLTWCYGDLGVSVALLSVAQAIEDERVRGMALEMARACTARTLDEGQGSDTGLCHGSAGAAHLFNRIWQATREAVFADAARTWISRALAMRNEHPIAGFPADMRLPNDLAARWKPDPALLTGATGVALALHGAVSNIEPAWDRLLLVDLATL